MLLKQLPNRNVISIKGEGALTFLDGLVTNHLDEEKLAKGELIHAALLTPQGKYRADFLISMTQDGMLLLDHDAGLGDDLLRALKMYKLRLPLELKPQAGIVAWHPNQGMMDPRDPALGSRSYGPEHSGDATAQYEELRIKEGIPDSPDFMIAQPFWLETGALQRHGVSMNKGCFIGQEVTARMHHRDAIRRIFTKISSDKAIPEAGTNITDEQKRPAGIITSRWGNQGLAYIRKDRCDNLQADGCNLEIMP